MCLRALPREIAPMIEDTLLRRLAVAAAACCAAMSLVAYFFRGGAEATRVIPPKLVAASSPPPITASASALTPAAPGGARRPNVALTIVVLVARYGLLAFLAYVMIARLRMPPLALLAGASAVVAAVGIEAGRLLRQRKP